MSFRFRHAGLILVAALAACAKSPTAPAGSTSVGAPSLVSPANGAVVPNQAQPVTLTINNGLVTDASAAVAYTFEVATDSAFSSVVMTKDAAQGAGQTSVKLDTLAPGRDYYWHARTKGDDTVGAYTTALKFTVGPAITFSTPVPVSPAAGGRSDARPAFTVTNSTRSGPAGSTSYRFEVSTANTFATILASGTVKEGSGTTSFTPTSDLPYETSLFWRVQAVDSANSATSAFTPAIGFTTALVFDLTKVNYQRWVNISAWPITNRIIEVDQDGTTDGHMCINHEKRGLWPTALFEDNPLVPVEATQWYFAKINGQWYGGAGEWLRVNQICKGGQWSTDIGKDMTNLGPMDNWIPKRGELVGYIISTPARAYPYNTTLNERSNLVVQPWVENGINTP